MKQLSMAEIFSQATGGNAPKTLASARAETMAGARAGTKCPCCGRFIKVYCRKLNAEMARFLIRLGKATEKKPGGWFSTRHILGEDGGNKASTDATYLVHWGLVERAEAGNSAGAPAGMFRLTTLGWLFIQDQATVPSHVELLNNEPVDGEEYERIGIRDALGSLFDYEELLADSAG